MRKYYTLLFSLLCIFVISCKHKDRVVDEATRSKILLVGNGGEPQSLDPHKTLGLSENDIMRALFEGLLWLDPATFKPLPGVAERWEVSVDGLHYIFFLRKDALWSNGDPVKAQDFYFAFKRALLPETGALVSVSFFDIQGAEDFNKGKINDFSEVGIYTPDDYTLELILHRPSPGLLTSLSNPRFAPLHEATLSKYGDAWIHPDHLVSNGPFRIKAWKINEVISLEKNPYYWDAKQVQLNGIQFFPIQNRLTEEKAFFAGQLHKTLCLIPQRAMHYLKEKSPFLRSELFFSLEYVLFNTQCPPLNDPRVRQALGLSIDREAIVNVFSGLKKARYNFVPPGFGNYESPKAMVENLAKARSLLAEAGYPQGKGFPTLKLMFNSDEIHQQTYEIIQAFWKEGLGINITLENKEWKTYLSDTQNGHFELSRRGWVPDFLDPSTFFELYYSGSPDNGSQWINPEFDKLFSKAQTFPDISARNAVYAEAEKILIEEVPALPLFSSPYYYLLDPRVKGVVDNGMHYFPWHHFFLEDFQNAD